MSVPKLRFKEFKGEWKLIKLGKIADKITSGARDWAQYYSENGSKFIRMTNLSRDGIYLKLDDLKFVNVKSESSDGQRTSLIHGDILISITAELGKIGWIPPNFGEAFINQHTGLVRLKKDQADSLFIAYLLSTAKLNKQINRLNDSGAKSGLNLPTIASINFHLPKISEQNKIADFLVTIDEKIAQLTQKCELLARYKKGVMQQLFSQQLRFKEFKENLLNTTFKKVVLSNQYGPRFNANNYDIDGNVKTIRGTDISLDGEIKYSQVPIAKLDFDFIKNHILKDGDLVMITTADCGLTGVFRKQDFDYISSAYAVKITLNKMGVPEYFKYFFQTNHAKNEVKSFIRKATVPNLPCSDILQIKLYLPDIQEQTKIANFLTSIDEKITEAQTYLDIVKQYKQGLLQQMFV